MYVYVIVEMHISVHVNIVYLLMTGFFYFIPFISYGFSKAFTSIKYYNYNKNMLGLYILHDSSCGS